MFIKKRFLLKALYLTTYLQIKKQFIHLQIKIEKKTRRLVKKLVINYDKRNLRKHLKIQMTRK